MPHRASFAFAEVFLSLPLDDLEGVERVRTVLHVVVVIVVVGVLLKKMSDVFVYCKNAQSPVREILKGEVSLYR